MEKYLIQLGVPIKDIFSEKQSESTVENASFTRRLLEEKGIHSAIVVTSPTHTRGPRSSLKRPFHPGSQSWSAVTSRLYSLKGGGGSREVAEL